MKRVALIVLAVLVLGIALLALNIGAVARFAITPDETFAAQTPPMAPDYAKPESWSALPEKEDLADRAPTGSPAVDQRTAAADVFFLHSTSYVGNRWNGPVDDAAVNEATDKGGIAIQGSVFNGCCAVYAPRYRQANGTAFTGFSDDGDQAIALGFRDVKQAFAAFNERRGPGRPFILAAHSQGSVHAERLLLEVIAGSPLREQLIAAYLVGGRLTVDTLRTRAPDILPCVGPADFHCAIAWNARGPDYEPNDFQLVRADEKELLCTNPLSWRVDGQPAAASAHRGAVFLDANDPRPRRGFADAHCVNGTLVLSSVGAAPRDLPSKVLDHVLGAQNYHPIEYQLFFMNLRENAIARVKAFTEP